MKLIPPSLANDSAIFTPDTDCMIADTRGMLRVIGHSSSPFLYLTRGVLRETFDGMHVASEYPGIKRYSLNVCDGSL